MSLMEQFANPELMPDLSFGAKMAGSGITALMGMGMTFLILILLWILIAVMGKIVSSSEAKKKSKNEPVAEPAAAADAGAAAAAPAAEAPAAAAPQTDQNEIIAVISAALAAYGDDAPKSNLIIKRIRRVSGQSTAWLEAARNQVIDSRRV